jgi:hypothetical protein
VLLYSSSAGTKANHQFLRLVPYLSLWILLILVSFILPLLGLLAQLQAEIQQLQMELPVLLPQLLDLRSHFLDSPQLLLLLLLLQLQLLLLSSHAATDPGVHLLAGPSLGVLVGLFG